MLIPRYRLACWLFIVYRPVQIRHMVFISRKKITTLLPYPAPYTPGTILVSLRWICPTDLKSGFYFQTTWRNISGKKNCGHTRNVKHGHRENSKGIKIRSRCCNIYLMHRYVYKQKQERREWGEWKDQKPLLLLRASLISSSTNQKPRTPTPTHDLTHTTTGPHTLIVILGEISKTKGNQPCTASTEKRDRRSRISYLTLLCVPMSK